MDQTQRIDGASGSTPPALSDAIEKIMANPELISMVASVLGRGNGKDTPKEESVGEGEVAVQSDSDEQDGAIQTDATAQRGDLSGMVASLLPLLTEAKGKGRADSDSACLLRALKPYVSEGRREAIDAMIRISEFSEILKKLH